MIRWRPIVAVLLFMSGWDTVGLLIGEQMFAGPSYDLLRDLVDEVTVAGITLGVRVYGLLLLAITGLVTWALLAHRYRHGSMSRPLRLGLSALAAYWVSWCAGLAMTFIAHGQIYAWGAIGKLVGIAAIAVLAARVPPPEPAVDSTTTGKVRRAVGAPAMAAQQRRTERPHPASGS
ncbi:hypothetical protein [Actinoplanes derwentensis]|uniref:hypothetical protein n=1 Tax=Actinoplanes derwentensis TaxID=113562 RepID=UPI000B80D77D|nr:hypothetical protein [Actinoplanes derwentensis]GID82030.1 hypothetical protein Ade03nite_09540 [Actinoplanes derwentensis]